MFVKIIRDTIIENPSAGRTSTQVAGNWEGSFKVSSQDNFALSLFIKKFEVMPGIIFTSYSNTFAEGIAELPAALLELNYKASKEPGIILEIKQNTNWQTVQHLALPKYLYDYENPPVICQNCGHAVYLFELDKQTDDDGNRFSTCPKCKGIDTYEQIYFEDINEVVKFDKRFNKLI